MKYPLSIGLKLHSTNTDLIPTALSLWKEDLFRYIELYIVPGSYPNTYKIWEKCQIPCILHAAHSYDGMNLACRLQFDKNFALFCEVQQFADALGADTIIVHGGMDGTIEETIYQVGRFEDKRIVLENKPRIAIRGEACVGSTPQEFQKAEQSGMFKGFVLDFGHAECAALSLGMDTIGLIKKFLVYRPLIFHLSDGESGNEKDTHNNFGKGNRDLAAFLGLVPFGARLTIETPRSPSSGLNDFVSDVEYLKSRFSLDGCHCSVPGNE
jgi:deoxyribonuclease-4